LRIFDFRFSIDSTDKSGGLYHQEILGQYHLEVEGEDFYIDLLFYHLRLRCFVVIDLKVEAFKPEFSGKMSFYVSAVDDLLKHRDDMPTIGKLYVKIKNRRLSNMLCGI
jgi:hypothetical protein